MRVHMLYTPPTRACPTRSSVTSAVRELGMHAGATWPSTWTTVPTGPEPGETVTVPPAGDAPAVGDRAAPSARAAAATSAPAPSTRTSPAPARRNLAACQRCAPHPGGHPPCDAALAPMVSNGRIAATSFPRLFMGCALSRGLHRLDPRVRARCLGWGSPLGRSSTREHLRRAPRAGTYGLRRRRCPPCRHGTSRPEATTSSLSSRPARRALHGHVVVCPHEQPTWANVRSRSENREVAGSTPCRRSRRSVRLLRPPPA